MSKILEKALAASILEAGAIAEMVQGPANPSYWAGVKTLRRNRCPDLFGAYAAHFYRLKDFRFYNIYEAKLYVDQVYRRQESRSQRPA